MIASGSRSQGEGITSERIEVPILYADDSCVLLPGGKLTLDFGMSVKTLNVLLQIQKIVLKNLNQKMPSYFGIKHSGRKIGMHSVVEKIDTKKMTVTFREIQRFQVVESTSGREGLLWAVIQLIFDPDSSEEEKLELNRMRLRLDEAIAKLTVIGSRYVFPKADWMSNVFTYPPGILADKIILSLYRYSKQDSERKGAEQKISPHDMGMLVHIQDIAYTSDPMTRLQRAVDIAEAFINHRLREVDLLVRYTVKKQIEDEDVDGAVKPPAPSPSGPSQDPLLKRFSEVIKFIHPDLKQSVENQIRTYLQAKGTQSAEYAERYLRFVLNLPFGEYKQDAPDLVSTARVQLEKDHYGMQVVKDEILEYLSARQLNPEKYRSRILCLIGPPGVGKTSLGISLGAAMQRPVRRIALGGVHEEPALRGHRLTYIGAYAGEIMRSIFNAKCMNPIIVLDEIDKLGRGSVQGNPEAALLEILDPEQNHLFQDHFVGGPFDLSQVFFIVTGNEEENIHPTLRDRLHIVHLPSYDAVEKLEIAARYLVPKQLANVSMDVLDLSIPPETLSKIIHHYTNESGVRALEERIAKICRFVARKVVEEDNYISEIHPEDLPTIFHDGGYPLPSYQPTKIGCATGLFVSSDLSRSGILLVELSRISKDRESQNIKTGMGETIRNSFDRVITLLEEVRPDMRYAINALFRSQSIHVDMGGKDHVDGPSAGIAFLCALYSLIKNVPVPDGWAMTGAVDSKSGLVYPVGGIKEKVCGAADAGVTRLILPQENQCAFEEVHPSIRKQFKEVRFVHTADEVLKIVFNGH